MQDIRKPYTRSRSSNDLQSRVEQFEAARYRRDDEDAPVQIPVKKTRRDVRDMDMYPRRRADDELYEDDIYTDDDNAPRHQMQREIRSRHPRKRASFSTVAFVFTTVAILVGVSLYTYVFDSATITVVPKYKDVNDLSKVFLFSKEGSDQNGIPYVVASTTISKSKTLSLSETRKVEAKAQGKVTIYNNYDGSPQKLIKNTRFESLKGKIYRINQSVEVPGKKGSVPGSLDVTLYADSNGADYNVDATEFTIPGFKGTPREKAFYAKSKGPMIGGMSGTVSLASLADINAAKDSLAVELGKEIESTITKVTKTGYLPMYSALEVTYEDNEADVLKGVTGTYTITAIGTVMLADEPKLAEAIAKTFGDYDNAPVRLAYGDTLHFSRKDTDHIVGTSSLPVLIEGKPRVIWKSDFASIQDMVKGKKRDDFKPLMKTINSIESAEISFSPVWLSHFPSETSKVNVEESLPKR